MARLDARLTATGSFRPGEPVTISTEALAILPAANGEVRLLLLDDDVGEGDGPRSRPAELGSWSGTLGRGQIGAALSRTITFAKPGYYRVAAVVTNTPLPSDVRAIRDTLVLDRIERHLWLLIHPVHGRVTDGYDPKAIPDDVVPSFGAYGPFKPRPSRTPRPAGPGARLLNGPYVTGVFKYNNWDTPQGLLTPAPGAEVQAVCYGRSDPALLYYDLVAYLQSQTGSDGTFLLDCGPAYEYLEGSVFLRNSVAEVYGEAGAFAGANFYSYGGEFLNLVAGNEYATRVFLDLADRVPLLFSRFGYTKGRVKAWVSLTSDTYGPNWCTSPQFSGCPAVDLIRTNRTRVFLKPGTSAKWDGLFTTIHEYAHGYHWFAVEPWPTGGDCSMAHSWTEVTSRCSAFVEGIADWISMVVNGGTIDVTPHGGDYGVENNTDAVIGGIPTNPPPSPNDDALRVEAAVAAFLYDVIDGSSDPDGPANESGPAEDHDNLTSTGYTVLTRLRYCRLDSVWLLSGLDQLIYCLEGNTSAYDVGRYLSPTWRQYSVLSFDQAVPSIHGAKVRALWEYNLYGIQ